MRRGVTCVWEAESRTGDGALRDLAAQPMGRARGWLNWTRAHAGGASTRMSATKGSTDNDAYNSPQREEEAEPQNSEDARRGEYLNEGQHLLVSRRGQAVLRQPPLQLSVAGSQSHEAHAEQRIHARREHLQGACVQSRARSGVFFPFALDLAPCSPSMRQSAN